MSDSTTTVSIDSAFGHHNNSRKQRQNRKLFMLVSVSVCACETFPLTFRAFLLIRDVQIQLMKEDGQQVVKDIALAKFFFCNARKSES